MIYKEFKGKKLSSLGMGTMRLPVIDGKNNLIDEEKTKEMFDYAIEKGVNYFDTAWGYHDGMSEIVTGKLLAAYPRDSYYIATKFPGYELANMSKVEEIFEKQLEKTGMEYFDFYLFHNVCEVNIDGYLNEEYGIFDYLMKQKENGRIKHLGFSVHGSYDTMKRFMDAYGEYMEFCQIQLNYIDLDFQDAKAKIELLEKYNIPIWVMEPLRGGKLASLAPEYEEKLKELRPEETIPAWAFRFLQTFPNVTVTLSGMSNFEQLKANIDTYEEEKPLSKEEYSALMEIADSMVAKIALPCTACRYCTTHCPMGLDIPTLLDLYNEHIFTGGGFLAHFALSTMPKDKWPSACLGCRKCEEVCPQQIKISEAMKDFVGKLG
ncbi:MAG: aldo/keto reductase [Lachnospiraceae bacterium]|nr:aldo/keto reductase [Lachnospiraceae bacterium]